MEAVHTNDFMCNVNDVQMADIIDYMYEIVYIKGQFICRQESVGYQLYVIAGKKDSNCLSG